MATTLPGWELPYLKSTARLGSLGQNTVTTSFYDVQAYPYTLPGVDPVFAVVGNRETIICRPSKEKDSGVEVIRWFQDSKPDARLNSCAWTQDVETGDPLICVSGTDPKIKILNVKTGALVRTLIGHGQEIEDLAVSPISPWILASASMDHSLRLWNLDPSHSTHPCMLICAGEGHKEGVLTIAFHHTGRYLLSGGLDCIVNLWCLPQLPDQNSGTDRVTVLHYPHFSTSAVHSNFVDCVAFHNDLILSKCAMECKIVLWRIEGFDSSAPVPPSDAAPSTHVFRETRSAFGGGYQRLLQFETVDTTPFYMRFSLFSQPFKAPILVIGNEKSKVFFWDLQRLETWTEKDDVRPRFPSKKGSKQPSVGLREASVASTMSSSVHPGSNDPQSSAGSGFPRSKERYGVEDPFKAIKPHKSLTVPRIEFAARRAAWSVGGEWLLVVGDQGMIATFHR